MGSWARAAPRTATCPLRSWRSAWAASTSTHSRRRRGQAGGNERGRAGAGGGVGQAVGSAGAAPARTHGVQRTQRPNSCFPALTPCPLPLPCPSLPPQWVCKASPPATATLWYQTARLLATRRGARCSRRRRRRCPSPTSGRRSSTARTHASPSTVLRRFTPSLPLHPPQHASPGRTLPCCIAPTLP